MIFKKIKTTFEVDSINLFNFRIEYFSSDEIEKIIILKKDFKINSNFDYEPKFSYNLKNKKISCKNIKEEDFTEYLNLVKEFLRSSIFPQPNDEDYEIIDNESTNHNTKRHFSPEQQKIMRRNYAINKGKKYDSK